MTHFRVLLTVCIAMGLTVPVLALSNPDGAAVDSTAKDKKPQAGEESKQEEIKQKKRGEAFERAKKKLDGSGGGSKVEELIEEISENMKKIEDLLKKKDTSSSTQEHQAKSVDLIEQLIEEANKT